MAPLAQGQYADVKLLLANNKKHQTALQEDAKTLAKMRDRGSAMLTMTKANSEHDYLYQLKVMPLLLSSICSLIQCIACRFSLQSNTKARSQTR